MKTKYDWWWIIPIYILFPVVNDYFHIFTCWVLDQWNMWSIHSMTVSCCAEDSLDKYCCSCIYSFNIRWKLCIRIVRHAGGWWRSKTQLLISCCSREITRGNQCRHHEIRGTQTKEGQAFFREKKKARTVSVNKKDVNSRNVCVSSPDMAFLGLVRPQQWTPQMKLQKCWHCGSFSQTAGKGLCGMWGLKERTPLGSLTRKENRSSNVSLLPEWKLDTLSKNRQTLGLLCSYSWLGHSPCERCWKSRGLYYIVQTMQHTSRKNLRMPAMWSIK